MYILSCNGYLNNDPRIINNLSDGLNLKKEYFLKLENTMGRELIHPRKYTSLIVELRPYLENWRCKNSPDKVLEVLKNYCQGYSYNLLVLLSSLETLSKIMNTEIIILKDSRRELYFHFGYSSQEYKQFTYDLENLLSLIKSVMCNSVF